MNYHNFFFQDNDIYQNPQSISIREQDTQNEKFAVINFCTSPISDLEKFMNQIVDPILCMEEYKNVSTFFQEQEIEDINQFQLSQDDFFECLGKDIFDVGEKKLLPKYTVPSQACNKQSDIQDISNTQAAENLLPVSRMTSEAQDFNAKKHNKDLRRAIEKNDKYDAIRDIVLCFQKNNNLKLEIEKMSHRSHQWLFTRLIKLRQPEMEGLCKSFIGFMQKNYQDHINAKYWTRNRIQKHILKQCVQQIIQGAKLYLDGQLQASLSIVYHEKKTKNRVSRESMNLCREKIRKLEQKYFLSSS